MSLVRIALRIAAVQALKGRTDVGSNVLDSQLGALDVTADGKLRTDQGKPFVTVYTDAARAGQGEDMPSGMDLDLRALTVNGATEIIFEAGITAAMVETDPETDEAVIAAIGIPSTDANLEVQLDVIMRQIGDALSDPASEWAEVFRSLCPRFIRIERSRTGSAEGQRMAAHQLKITAELLADPIKGQELRSTSSMAKFLVLADTLADPDLQTQVAVIRAAIAGQEYSWQTVRRRYGLTGDEADAMLLTTPPGAEPDVAISELTAVDAVSP